jgi:hypothetical protein
MTSESGPVRVQVIHSEARQSDTHPYDVGQLQPLNHWLEALVSAHGSDLLLVPHAPASIRVEGVLQAVGPGPLAG